MASSRLYPTLSKFYQNGHVEYGSEDDVLCGVPEEKLYRKSARDVKMNNNNPLSIDNTGVTGVESPGTSSARPRRDMDLVLLQYLNDVIAQQGTVREFSAENDVQRKMTHQNDSRAMNIKPLGVDTSTNRDLANPEGTEDDLGFSSLYNGSNSTMGDSWVDELLPDYDFDVSVEENIHIILNNLNKSSSRGKPLRNKHIGAKVQSQVSESLPHSRQMSDHNALKPKDFRKEVEKENMPVARGSTNTPRKHKESRQSRSSPHRGSEGPTNNMNIGHVREAAHPHQDLAGTGADDQRVRAENPERVVKRCGAPGSAEYNAWMTWRKQVNRQLATVILLRRGENVRLQRSDLWRKPLSQSSIDFVVQQSRKDKETSLAGKPFVMYGIPRVSLANVQW